MECLPSRLVNAMHVCVISDILVGSHGVTCKTDDSTRSLVEMGERASAYYAMLVTFCF